MLWSEEDFFCVSIIKVPWVEKELKFLKFEAYSLNILPERQTPTER